jgi:hypothetical protein
MNRDSTLKRIEHYLKCLYSTTTSTATGILQLDKYNVQDVDDPNPINYYGYEDAAGNWYIIKEDITALPNTYRYVAGTGDYPTNWTARTGLVYDYISNTNII